jgi:hypothetical protein
MTNEEQPLSDLRAAAVDWMNADKQQQAAGETFACRITTYKASNVRVSEFTLNDASLEDIKAYTYFALNRPPYYAFEVVIWTNELTRLLLRIDSEKVGYDKAIKTLTDYFKQAGNLLCKASRRIH